MYLATPRLSHNSLLLAHTHSPHPHISRIACTIPPIAPPSPLRHSFVQGPLAPRTLLLACLTNCPTPSDSAQDPTHLLTQTHMHLSSQTCPASPPLLQDPSQSPSHPMVRNTCIFFPHPLSSDIEQAPHILTQPLTQLQPSPRTTQISHNISLGIFYSFAPLPGRTRQRCLWLLAQTHATHSFESLRMHTLTSYPSPSSHYARMHTPTSHPSHSPHKPSPHAHTLSQALYTHNLAYAPNSLAKQPLHSAAQAPFPSYTP